MKVEYFKKYSNCLQRDMEFKIYGHGEFRYQCFQLKMDAFMILENFGMINTISDKIEEGKVQVFCIDSVDSESWSDECGDKRHRVYIMEQWYYYVVDELVPTILI